MESLHNIILYFPWNLYLKTDCTSLFIVCSTKDPKPDLMKIVIPSIIHRMDINNRAHVFMNLVKRLQSKITSKQ